jgi:hypothetical protein
MIDDAKKKIVETWFTRKDIHPGINTDKIRMPSILQHLYS